MRFSTAAVFHTVEQSLIDSLNESGDGGGKDWSSAARISIRGRVGRSVGYGRLEYDPNGDVISDAQVAAAARPGRGGSWAMRLSVPLNFDGSNATAQAPVIFDVAKCAGLQGAAYWTQRLDPSTAALLSHHAIQSEFPGISNVDAKALSASINGHCTSTGDFSELFYRLNALGDDLFSGCECAAPTPAQSYGAWLNSFWPGGAATPNYTGLLTSFSRTERQYYLVGNRTNAYLTAGVIRALAAIQRANCGLSIGPGRRNAYCASQQFGDTLGLWCKGSRSQLYVDPSLPGGTVTGASVDDVLEAIAWLRIVTGDDVGYSASCCAFTERLPFVELQRNCTGLGPELRCAITPPSFVAERLEVGRLLVHSWEIGAVDPALPAAYDRVFGASAFPPVADVFFDPARARGFGGMEVSFQNGAGGREMYALLSGSQLAGGFGAAAAHLTRHELALAVAFGCAGNTLPCRLRNKAGSSLTAATFGQAQLPSGYTFAEVVTACGSPSPVALPAVGLRVRTQFAATNGLSVWHATINAPSEAMQPATIIKRERLPLKEEYFANLCIIGVFTRALADEIETSCGRCAHLMTLVSGGEPVSPGMAATWTPEQLEHSQDVFMQRELRSGRDQLLITRGARHLLWPALNSFTGAGETVATCDATGGQWNMAVCFSALQRECITGLPASVGGLIKNTQIFTHIYRKQPDFINSNVVDSDLSRSNRLHILACFAALHEQTVFLEYAVRYKQAEYGDFDDYTIPFGSIQRVRCDGTAIASEVVTTLAWQRVLSEQQIVLVTLNALPCSGLVNGRTRTRFACAPGWLPSSVGSVEQDPGDICVGLRFGPVPNLLDTWRHKVNLGNPLVITPGRPTVMRAVIDAFVHGISIGRRLMHVGASSVLTPWVSVRSAPNGGGNTMQLLLNEAGANRAMAKIADHLGAGAEAVAASHIMDVDRKRLVEERKLAENAAAPQSADSIAMLQRQVNELTAALHAAAASGALKGGLIDAQRPDAADASMVSGLTEPTTGSGSLPDGERRAAGPN